MSHDDTTSKRTTTSSANAALMTDHDCVCQQVSVACDAGGARYGEGPGLQ